MILSHAHRFIFFCNGKTGTTSIENVLKPFDESDLDMNNGAPGLWANKHIPPAVMKSFVRSDVWECYFKFVFVRHPLDWLVSQYRFNIQRPEFSAGASLRNPKKALKLLRHYRIRHRRASKEVYDEEDIDFLYQYLRRFRALPDSQTLLQSNYVYDVDGKVLVDFVGRFEQLGEDLAKVKSRIEIDFELPHLNRTDHRPYRECFTEGAIERVKMLWKADFENFGY